MGVESCDDKNESDTDVCISVCEIVFCGDQFVFVGVEECDDGNTDEIDSCLSSC